MFLACGNAQALNAFSETGLVSDRTGLPANVDASLVNPWGIACSSASSFCMAKNGSSLAAACDGSGSTRPSVFTIPSASGSAGRSVPTGVTFNLGSCFELTPERAARHFLAAADGVIAALNPSADPSHALRKFDNSSIGANDKGLAFESTAGRDFVFAANFKNGTRGDRGLFGFVTASASTTVPDSPSPFDSMGGIFFIVFGMRRRLNGQRVSTRHMPGGPSPPIRTPHEISHHPIIRSAFTRKWLIPLLDDEAFAIPKHLRGVLLPTERFYPCEPIEKQHCTYQTRKALK